MKYNLTEKLKFNEKPVIVIKDEEITIDSSATTVLKIMDVMNNDADGLNGALACATLLFSDADRTKLDKLGLSIEDYIKVVQVGIDMALGNNPDDTEEAGE